MNRVKRTAVTVVLTAGITASIVACSPHANESQSKLAPVNTKHYVDHNAVLSALSETPQLVGLTGDVSKTVRLSNDKWFGDKTYELTLNGEFKLGVDSEDIEVTTKGNTIVVRFPQPKIIAVELPFDQASIKKDVGLFRGDLDEGELQALYGEARDGVIADINADEKARAKAERSVEHAVEDVLETVPYVEAVVFTD